MDSTSYHSVVARVVVVNTSTSTRSRLVGAAAAAAAGGDNTIHYQSSTKLIAGLHSYCTCCCWLVTAGTPSTV
jgi:hypothetical protein